MSEAAASGELRGAGITLRSLEPAHHEALRAIRLQPEVLDWWGPIEEGFPEEEPTAERFAVLLDDGVVGMVQFTEEHDPDYRYAEVDIFIDAGHLSRGLGTDALTTLAAYLIGERRHHRIVLSTNVHNRRAVRCYEKVGFRRVGITRRSGRDYRTGRYEDEVFMELVVEPRIENAPDLG